LEPSARRAEGFGDGGTCALSESAGNVFCESRRESVVRRGGGLVARFGQHLAPLLRPAISCTRLKSSLGLWCFFKYLTNDYEPMGPFGDGGIAVLVPESPHRARHAPGRAATNPLPRGRPWGPVPGETGKACQDRNRASGLRGVGKSPKNAQQRRLRGGVASEDDVSRLLEPEGLEVGLAGEVDHGGRPAHEHHGLVSGQSRVEVGLDHVLGDEA